MHNPFESLSLCSDKRPSTDALIEDYLDHLCAPLINRTTYEQRLEVREEVRSHLLVLTAAHEELGSSPLVATYSAMEQFGEATKIGRSLSGEYPRHFVPNGPLIWTFLHAAIGGGVGSIACVAMDLTLLQTQRIHFANLPVDCLLGFLLGLMPGKQLLKRPASPLRAGIRTGSFYLAVTTGLMTVLVILGPKHLQGPSLETYRATIRTVIISMGVNGAVGGAMMSFLFRCLRRFAPRSKSEITSYTINRLRGEDSGAKLI